MQCACTWQGHSIALHRRARTARAPASAGKRRRRAERGRNAKTFRRRPVAAAVDRSPDGRGGRARGARTRGRSIVSVLLFGPLSAAGLFAFTRACILILNVPLGRIVSCACIAFRALAAPFRSFFVPRPFIPDPRSPLSLAGPNMDYSRETVAAVSRSRETVTTRVSIRRDRSEPNPRALPRGHYVLFERTDRPCILLQDA